MPEVTWAIPGETAAHAVLDDFVNSRMKLYEKRQRSIQAAGAETGCRLGCTLGRFLVSDARSRQRKAVGKASPPAYESFFEELVVRRELSDNFCYYSPKYDQIEGQKYDWAKDTLRLHASDKRPYLYSLEELERAKTHDDLWNAAQRELRYGGKMHGFCRMYWAKKILEWTESPEQSVEVRNLFERHVLAGWSRSERLRRMHVVHRGRARSRLERARSFRQDSIHGVRQHKEEV